MPVELLHLHDLKPRCGSRAHGGPHACHVGRQRARPNKRVVNRVCRVTYFTIGAAADAVFFTVTRFGKYRRTTMSPTLCTHRNGTLTARLPSTRSGFVSPMKMPSTTPLSTSTTRLFTLPRNTPLCV